jgi:hypothetical protein
VGVGYLWTSKLGHPKLSSIGGRREYRGRRTSAMVQRSVFAQEALPTHGRKTFPPLQL